MAVNPPGVNLEGLQGLSAKRLAGCTGSIVCGDAVVALDSLVQQGERFDVIIADPPYNIGKDFGQGKGAMPLDKYVEWSVAWIRDCLELLTESGLLYVYGFPEYVAHIAVRFPLHQQRWLVWHYTNKTAPRSKFWQRSHESIVCLWKREHARPKLEVDQIREPYTEGFLINSAGKVRTNTPSRYQRTGSKTTYVAHVEGALPRDVIKLAALAGGAGRAERWFMCRTCDDNVYPPSALEAHRDHRTLKHPTQKPQALTQRLIRSRIIGTQGRLLIPFAGSGSECVVANRMGVEFLGIEINPVFVDFAQKWLRSTAAESANDAKTPLGSSL